MSTARVRLKFGEILNQAFCAGAANVIFRRASTGVWVKEVRARVREYASTREKFVDPSLDSLVDTSTRLGMHRCIN